MGHMDFYEQFKRIQKDRWGVVHSSVYPGIKSLVSEIYPEEAHLIYELLQNAEDANASAVCFEISKNQLIFKHNGTKMFDADDVESITNIGKSTKRESYVQAGKFGIGFKSVYAFTDTPSIYCDTVCFRIEQLLMPIAIEDLKHREHGWTVFCFPFDSDKISPENPRIMLRRGLTEIESTTLLFLNHIRQLDYRLENGERYSVKKETDGKFVTCKVWRNQTVLQKKHTWMRFSKKALLHGKEVMVDLAFPMKQKDREGTYDFDKGEDKVCITFLARNEKSNLRFFINAPFGCTPSRDSINKDDSNNVFLISEIAALMQSTITELRNSHYLSDSFFEIMPLETDEIPKIYQPIAQAIREFFCNYDNIPTLTEGRFVTASNGIMASKRRVVDKIISQADVRILFQNNDLCFVKNYPVSSRAYLFLKSLNLRELSPETMLLQMEQLDDHALWSWIGKKENQQLASLYEFLSPGISDLERKATQYREYRQYADGSIWHYDMTEEKKRLGRQYLSDQKLLQRIKDLPIVKLTDGSYVAAVDTYLSEEGLSVPGNIS